jgi:hypothetical protein
MFTTTAHTGTGAELATTEWGPAKHDPEHPLRRALVDSLGTALRDDDDARPDDN